MKSLLALALISVATAVAAAKFEIALKPGLATNALDGRLVLVLSPTNYPEPRLAVDSADARGPFLFGRDAVQFTSRRALELDEAAAAGLGAKLSQIPAGRYFAQAVLDVSRDQRGLNAAGNFFSELRPVQFDPASREAISLELTQVITEPPLAENELVKFVTLQSRLLSEFHQRPMFLRAGIILPRDYAHDERLRRYPLWIHIGGYGARFSRVAELMRSGAEFRQDWLRRETPQMIYVLLDGVGPNGDPYQVNSANNGSYGDAVVKELIPHIEREFRATGVRVLTGKSTGGWAALALQIFYPDSFHGVWASCPDSVDFRSFELVNIYEDENAFVNHHGEERPSARDENGDVRLLMRREVQWENVLGRGGQWTRSGAQWGAWNAVYSPRGADGMPVPLWDADGKINRAVAEQWKKYDLRLVLESNWSTLAPKLGGKLHLFVGEADDYFLNNAVHLLDDTIAARAPKGFASFSYGAREGHGWMGLTLVELMKQLQPAAEAKR